MFIGVLWVRLYASEPQSLKDKRRILKSLIQRLQNKFNISVAESGAMDSWNDSELGIVCVSNESTHANSVVSNVLNFIECDGWFEVTDTRTEIIHY